MGELRELVLDRLAGSGALERLARREAARAEAARLERARDEADRKVPLWDRLLFFIDSPDEQQRDALAEAARKERAQVAALDAQVEADLAQVGREVPPFAVAVALERVVALALGLAADRRDGRTALAGALGALAREVVATWTPGVDLEAVLGELKDEAACRDAASVDVAVEPHHRMGIAPVSARELVPLVAARLLASGWSAERERLARLDARREELAAAHAAAVAAVPLADKLNPLTDSPAEAARDALGKELSATEQARVRSAVEVRRLLLDGLAAYPPLALHQALLEAEGVAALVTSAAEPFLGPDGALGERQVLEPWGLVVAALRRARSAFSRAFADVPRVDELARAGGIPREGPDRAVVAQAAQAPPRAASPRERSIEAVLGQLRAAGADELRLRALGLAGLRAGTTRDLARASAAISLLDRLVFWSDSAAEAEARRHRERSAWLAGAANQAWEELLEATASACAAEVPFHLRDQAIRAARTLAQVRTDGGESSSPRSCAVYDRAPVLEALGVIRQALAEAYGIRTTRAQAIERFVAEASGRPPALPSPAEPFRPLPEEAALQVMAQVVRGTELAALHARIQAARGARAVAEDQRQAAAGRVSFWDTLNVFSTTPDEAHRDELAADVARLDADLRADLLALDAIIERAAEAYPPAALAWSIEGVVAAVESIRAACRSRTVTIGTGKDRRTETRYYCSLVGHDAARSALRAWIIKLVRVFGALPSHRALLAGWTLEGRWDPPEDGLEDAPPA